MSDFDSLENSREYRFGEWYRYTKTRPLACQPLMKNYWQCFDYYHFVKKEDAGESRAKCLEKFNYEECFNENKTKLIENWPLNVKITLPQGAAEEESEE
jgi:hypothetical protein